MDDLPEAGAASLLAFFPMAQAAMALLKDVHGRRPFHGCINTASLGLHLPTPQQRMASLLAASLEHQDFGYIAPEQTGRLNRAIDYRSDYYSLGVVFYELLTGQLPFTLSDPMEMVHSHIAQHPVPPTVLAPWLPRMVSEIVLKLLSKNAEERYQSIDGLMVDLNRCEEAFRECGEIAEFALGQHDLFDRLQFSRRLFGREADVQSLLKAFGRVVHGGNELLLVTGYSGVGKSSLVNEIHQAAAQSGGVYLSGKFDQYKRNVPYATLATAFRDMVSRILGSNEADMIEWRAAILHAVGNNGRLLIDLIPELGFVIGEHPAVPELNPGEAENRFLSVFRKFVGVFARPGHPLVLFVDDMQWMDAGSMKLLESLATHAEMRYLLLIGAYRDNEFEPAHLLRRCLASIRSNGGIVQDILLGPLTFDDLGQMVADTLRCEPAHAASLVQLLHAQTGGNPFFVVQFLTALHEEGLLSFDLSKRSWEWDIERIRAKGFTDNVIELMVAKLRRMPPSTLDLLKHLSCLGTRAPIVTLTDLLNVSPDDAHACVDDAQRAGFIYRQEDGIRFSHDRIQEAAYSLISPQDRSAMHLQIGRLLIARMTPAEIDGAVFELVHQFNYGAGLIGNADERETVCRLNAVAGRKAMASAAYASASSYLAQAIEMLPPGAWNMRYEDTFTLYLECARCESVIGNFHGADALLDVILAHARSKYDRAQVLQVRVRMYWLIGGGRGRDGLSVGMQALKLFGIFLPETDDELLAFGEAAQQEFVAKMQGRRIADLIDLPVATDPDVRVIIRLLAELITVAYSVWPPVAQPMLMKALDLSLQHGNTEDSCVMYSNYGLLLAGAYGDIPGGYAFSEMSLRLNERFRDARLVGRLLFIHGYAFNATRRPLATSLPLLEQAFIACREAGNSSIAGASIDALTWMAWESGKSLDEVMQIAAPYKEYARTHNTFSANSGIYVFERLVAKLTGMPVAGSDAELLASIGKGRNYNLGHYHIVQQAAHYLFLNYDEAMAAARQAETMPSSLRALGCMVTHHFYHALTLAALYQGADTERQEIYHEAIKRQLLKLRQWSDSCPESYLDRYALASAELARIDGADMEAMRLYEVAIAAARDHGFLQNEALAHELLARFFHLRGFASSAAAHLQIAHDRYLRWGATGKAAQLQQSYPDLLGDRSRFGANASLMSGRIQDLDVMAVVKASQAVSGEIVLGRLTESLLKTVLENAGAERGLLILRSDHNYHIVASATVQNGKVAVMLQQSQVSPEQLPLAMFHYVIRTGEKVLLDDASAPNPYATDLYVQKNRLKSVLCLPLKKQARLVGVLHLENRLASGVFTPSRIAMLELLASQAVISLENAELYSELQAENSERKRIEEELRKKTNEIGAQASFMDAVIENIPVAVFVKNARDGFRFTLWNRAAEEIFRMPKRAVIGRLNQDVWPAGQAGKILEDDETVAREKRTIDIPVQSIDSERLGAVLLHTIKVPLINPEDGETDYLLGISEDITERKQTESMIWQQANFDALTGLPNRSRFREQLWQEIAGCKRDKSILAILFIDLDRFKEVNDTLGHDKGDILLVEAARRICACARQTDTVGRQGGDEFTVILSRLSSPEPVGAIAQKIIDALCAPFQLGQEQAFISASIGITIYPDDGAEIEDLLKHADQALYVAKDSGRNRFRYFTPALQAAALHRMRLTKDLRGALENSEFRVYFQPIVELASGRIRKAEALIRWQHPQRGMISPAEFIPLAEVSGLIIEIGEWVFLESIRWAKRWRSEHDSEFQISINQSPLEFQRQGDRYDRWINHLLEIGLPGQAVVMEITEGLLLDAGNDVTSKLFKLRDAGIQVALDDFGTGYSSLAYLKKFDIDYLKIDQAFIRNLAFGSSDMALCEAIVVMAHKLGLKVVAEGVETNEQHDLLRTAGSDYVQGFLFARPMPAEEFDEFLAAMRPST
jgi:diguanylate cyclase (GGDEF)-like protein/PAS domain S-box-containing protein